MKYSQSIVVIFVIVLTQTFVDHDEASAHHYNVEIDDSDNYDDAK